MTIMNNRHQIINAWAHPIFLRKFNADKRGNLVLPATNGSALTSIGPKLSDCSSNPGHTWGCTQITSTFSCLLMVFLILVEISEGKGLFIFGSFPVLPQPKSSLTLAELALSSSFLLLASSSFTPSLAILLHHRVKYPRL